MKDHIRFTPTGAREPAGFRVFQFTAYKDGNEVGRLSGRSGSVAHQALRGFNDRRAKPGSAEPIPEGVYSMGWPEYEKAHGEGWPAGLNGRWIGLHPKNGYELVGGRGDFGAHPDGAAPGSLGCAVTYSNESWEQIANWVRDLGLNTLIVDHGLGLVPPLEPTVKQEAVPTATVTLNGDRVGTAFIIEGTTVPTMATLAALLGAKIEWKGPDKTVALTLKPDESRA